ncbi:MAG: hypothetical protein NW208_01400 [Bryobacter sp.]|nr:hypothetical protein [Bryobacter sp.]
MSISALPPWRSTGLLLLLSLSFCFLLACGASEEASVPKVKAILGATLIDGTPRQPQVNSVLLIAAGKIQSIGTLSSLTPPADAEQTNATGLYVTPSRGGLQLLPGADADLFLVNGNPIDNPYLLGSPVRTMKAGEWIDGPTK